MCLPLSFKRLSDKAIQRFSPESLNLSISLPLNLLLKSFHNRLNRRQHFIGMALEIDIFPDLFDLAIRADEDGTAENTHKLLAVTLPFTPEA